MQRMVRREEKATVVLAAGSEIGWKDGRMVG